MSNAGKIALATGAASGIGRATADLFAEEGAIVCATDIAHRDDSGRIRYVSHDISSEDQWIAQSRLVEDEQGSLDVLVNIYCIWGLICAVGVASYQASRGAVTTPTKNAALTYAPTIRASSIHAGAIETQITARLEYSLNPQLIADTPLKRMAEPREVAGRDRRRRK